MTTIAPYPLQWPENVARTIRKHHPDAGGSAQQAAEINRARDEGLKAAG